MEQLILIVYILCLTVLFFFGAHGFVMVFHYYKHRHEQDSDLPLTHYQMVTVQLPVFNEMYVVRRLIEFSCAIDYPQDISQQTPEQSRLSSTHTLNPKANNPLPKSGTGQSLKKHCQWDTVCGLKQRHHHLTPLAAVELSAMITWLCM